MHFKSLKGRIPICKYLASSLLSTSRGGNEHRRPVRPRYSNPISHCPLPSIRPPKPKCKHKSRSENQQSDQTPFPYAAFFNNAPSANSTTILSRCTPASNSSVSPLNMIIFAFVTVNTPQSSLFVCLAVLPTTFSQSPKA
jgi:hypothetical protein